MELRMGLRCKKVNKILYRPPTSVKIEITDDECFNNEKRQQ